MKLSKMTEEDFFKRWPDDWPAKENFVSVHKITKKQFSKFNNLIEKGASETSIEKFLSSNKEVLALTAFLFTTGHHAAWIFPKQQIRPSAQNGGGKIPDYILAGANSDGVSWYVLELKGANEKIFTKTGKNVYLSSIANKGICQLIQYIDISTKSQSYLRDELRFKNYREPKGILLIGTEDELDDSQSQSLKAAWNRLNKDIQIISYSRLLQIIKEKVDYEYATNKSIK